MSKLETRMAAGTLAGTAGLVVTFSQALIQVPLLLTFWGSETYGAWMALGAATAFFTSIDLGHQNYVGNEFNRLWLQSSLRVRVVLGSGMRVAFAIAGAEFAIGVGLALSGRLEWLIGGGSAGVSGPAFAFALILYLSFWCANGSVGGLLVRLYPPAGLYARSQWLGVGMRLSSLAALLISVAFGASILGAMCAQIIAWTAVNWLTMLDLRHRLPQIRPWFREGDWSTGWRNFRISLVLTLNGIVEQFAGNGLVLIVMRILAPAQVAIFTTLRTVANVAVQGTSVLLNPLLPDLVRFDVQREPEKLRAVFAASWFVGGTLVCLGFVVAVLVIRPLYELWTRGVLPFDPALFSTLALAVVVRQWAAPMQAYLFGINRLPPQTVTVLVRSSVSLVGAATLLYSLGPVGAGLGLLGGEIGAAVVVTVSASDSLRRIGGSLPRTNALLAIGQILATASSLAAFATGVSHAIWVTLALVVVTTIGVVQWVRLPSGVRTRMCSLFTLLRNRCLQQPAAVR